MSHLKVIVNPKDELSWNRILMLIDKIGPKTAGMITDECVGHPSLEGVLKDSLPKYYQRYAYSEGIEKLGRTLGNAYDEKLPAGDRFGILLEYYLPLLKNKYDDWHLRLNDLEALRQITMRYDSVEELLEDFAIEPPDRGVWRVEPETKEEEKPLVLSTIHSAKGLEWDVVFIVGLIDGVLPVTFALDSEDELEEEQRLLYVAVTRAKTMLYLTMHHEGAKGFISQFNKISRFIDMPNVLTKLDLRDIAGADTGAIRQETGEMESPVYDKQALLEKIVKFYK
jgi:DNA helicase-2/ATP-dependent DNA helicase PcrA